MPAKRPLLILLTIYFSTSLLFGGTISGKVIYTGTPAKPRTIDMSKEPTCAQQHPTPITGETVVTGPNNGLDNVVVYISSGAPDESQVPQHALTFDQKGCQYLPHVVVIHTGQEMKILNSDQAMHNIHALSKANAEWNKSQPPGAPPISVKYDKPEFISVKCNVHPWMHGEFAVLNTSHYDLTKGAGAFALPNLPPGKYIITAWHEDYGTKTAEVMITGNESKEVNFTFTAKSY